MRKNRGLTIVQVMVILLVAGLIGKCAVDYLVERRCASEPANALCRK